jgi:hypothetical protein
MRVIPVAAEIIGHLETQEGQDLGELVIVNRGRGRGRPRGKRRRIRFQCDICGRGFQHKGRYIVHKYVTNLLIIIPVLEMLYLEIFYYYFFSGVITKGLNLNAIHATRDFPTKKILICIRKQRDILGRVSYIFLLPSYVCLVGKYTF